MKITGIRTHILQSALSEPFAFSQGWIAQRSATLVEVTTDTGTSGWGEAFARGMEAPQISAAAIEHALAPLVLDADPLDIEFLWHRVYHGTRDDGRKGSVVTAISAIGIAQPIELHDSMVEIPDGPGLGIEVVAETLDRYRVN